MKRRTIFAACWSLFCWSAAPAQYCAVGRATPACPTALSITQVEFRDSFDTTESSFSGCDPSGYEAPWGLGSSIFGSAHGAPVTVTVRAAGLLPTDVVTVWLDYDFDGTFGAAESFAATMQPSFGGTWKAVCDLATPACWPQTGLARLRVAAVRGLPAPAPACGYFAVGDWEDYDYFLYPGVGLGSACPTVVNLGPNVAPMTWQTGTWVSFTPPSTGGYFFDTNTASALLQGVYVLQNGTPVAYTGMTGNGGECAVALTGGQTYLFNYQDYFNPGSLFLVVSALANAPADDECAGATPVFLGTTPNLAMGSATGSGGQAPCALFRDRWFSFTAPFAGAFAFTATGSAPAAVNLYSACGGAALACGANAATTSLAAGQTCLVRLGDALVSINGASFSTVFDLQIAPTSPPTTTLTATPGALSLAVSGGVPGSAYFFAVTFNQGAFPNGPFFGIDPDFGDVWAQFNAGPPFVDVLGPNGSRSHGPFVGLPAGLTFYAVTVTNVFGATPIPTAPVSVTTL